MTTKQINLLADAIQERHAAFDPGGAVQFGIEEAALAVAEVLQAQDPGFDATDFKHRCFAGREIVA